MTTRPLGMVLVRETVMADWQAWRDIRLQALRDAPDAFGSTYAEQNRLGEDSLAAAGRRRWPLPRLDPGGQRG